MDLILPSTYTFRGPVELYLNNEMEKNTIMTSSNISKQYLFLRTYIFAKNNMEK